MRKLLIGTFLFPGLIVLAGCPKKGDTADAAAEAAAEDAAAATAAPAGPDAKNKADVAQFPAQVAVVDDAQRPAVFVNARTSPKAGNVVAGLKPGTDITKVAEYQDCFLVTFADPKDASSTLMGWIEKSSFTYVAPKDAGVKDGSTDAAVVDAGAPAVVDAGPPKCAANEALVTLSATTTACKKKCTSDKDCKNGPCANATTTTKAVARVCAAD